MILTLLNKKSETPSVVSYIFQSDTPVSWLPGQFVKYRLTHPSPDSRGEVRFFTISSAPFEQHVQITTRFAAENGSSFKNALNHLEIGDTIEASDPMGDFVLQEPEANYILIAGGIGITPYHSMIMQQAHDNLPIKGTLLYANRDSNIVFAEELDEAVKSLPGFKINYIVDPNRIDLALIQQTTERLSGKTYIYLSGPKPMVGGFEKELLNAGFKTEIIKSDYFPGYVD